MTWYPHDDPRQLNLDLHRWHEAMWGAVTGILEGGVLLSLLWKPRAYPLLIQFMALAVIFAALLVLPFQPDLLFVIIVATLLIAAYPAPRALIDFSRDGPISRLLLTFSLAATLLLLPYTIRLLLWQIQGVGGEQATANEWIGDVEHTTFLLIALFLATTKRPGWWILSILTGIVFLYLGVAALALPNQAGSWGVIGGIASLIGGALYIIATIREVRKMMNHSTEAFTSTA
jgi:hypothetical protein